MGFRRFEDIKAWQEARVLTRQVYAVTRAGSFYYDFALKDQITRSALSVMGNIAEGFGREGNAEFISFLTIASGSCEEVSSHLYAALDAGHVTDDEFKQLRDQADLTSRLLHGLILHLKRSKRRGPKYDY